MKAVMYHYVRNSDKEMPFFRYLSVSNFKKQLAYFEKEYGVVSYDTLLGFLENRVAYEKIEGKVLLTFDDGFIEHYETVYPLLKEKGYAGIFYVPTGVYEREKALDVHRIHYLLGRYGGEMMLEALQGLLEEYMLDKTHYDEFKDKTYKDQINDDATDAFKKIFNYYIAYEYREQVLDALVEKFTSDEEIFDGLYITRKHMREMHLDNMIIGSHSVNHFVMSKLSSDEQKLEIERSFSFIESLLGELKIKTFCYPYGGFHSFSDKTEALLEAEGCDFSFNVESRDVTQTDFETRAQALPRYDCNLFPFGQANLG